MKYLEPEDVKVLFMGTPEIAVPSLRALVENGYQVIGLVTQEDKEIGRKKVLSPTPCKAYALSQNIPVFQPHKIRKELDWANGLEFDVIVTMAYGQIVPDALLSMAKVGAVNLHGSLLPAYRGAAPIQRAIENGEKETGITLMEMVHEMDAGKMYAKASTPIGPSETYSSLANRLSDIAATLLINHLMDYVNGNIVGEEQDPSKVTFADKISVEEETLNIHQNAISLIHKINALSEDPGGHVVFREKKLKILGASLLDEVEDEPIGTLSVRAKKLALQAKGGHISLDFVLPEGKKAMSGRDYAGGARILPGEKVS